MSLRHQSLPRTGFLPQAVEALLRTWSYRFAGIGLGILALLFWLVLLTWKTQTGGDLSDTSGNALGPVGSIIADLLIQSLGLTAVVAVLPLMFFATELFQKERVSLLSARLVFWPASVILMAGGFAAIPTVAAWPLQHGFGGLTGDFLFTFARQILDTVEPSLGGIIAGLALAASGSALLFRALNLMPRDLLLVLQFEPRRPHTHADGAITRRRRLPRLGAFFRRKRTARGADPYRTPQGNAQLQPAVGFHPAQPLPHEPSLSEPTVHAAHQQTSGTVMPPTVQPDTVYAHAPVHAAPPAAYLLEDDDDLPRCLGRGTPNDSAEAAVEADSRMIAARFAPSIPPAAAAQTQVPETGGHRKPAASPLLTGIRPAKRPGQFRLPATKLLARDKSSRTGSRFAPKVLRGNAGLLEDVLADFGVKGQIVGVHPGPVVTLYELEPARGVKAARVIGLADDIARSMSAHSARIAVVPGKNAIGIELPNPQRDNVLLRDLLEDDAFTKAGASLPLAIGKAINGSPVVTDLAGMPHLLVAGTTGSGKSVGINGMILSLLYRHTPETCQFIMIDPKMLELSVYNGIPHLLTPVVTDPHKAVLALNWAVREMEERYKRMSELGVRNMPAYNTRLAEAERQNKPIERMVQTGFDTDTGEPVYESRSIAHTPMAYIVIVIDEMADLMMTAGKDIEAAIQRLAQMARAAGIHLITATQRPSVDVITGTVKANLPTRISFKLTTAIDSRTILGQQGAEQLLGAGDMLFSQGGGQINRVHGPFVSEDEVEAVVSHLAAQGAPRHNPEIIEETPVAKPAASGTGGMSGGSDSNALYDKAVAIVLRDNKASTSYVQRRLSIGYNRAADLIERMESDGIVSPAGPTGRREILQDRI